MASSRVPRDPDISQEMRRFLDDLDRRVQVLGSHVVADLPSAASVQVGTRALVTDANATTFASTVAGGGANIVPVYSDGTNWKIG